MDTDKKYIKRLEKVAEHLESGELGHKKFNFEVYNYTPGANTGPRCGTMGCAIGEFPILFKRDWLFYANGSPLLRDSQTFDTSGDVAEYLGLNTDEVRHLFYPNRQITYMYGGKELTSRSTRKQVAKNIRIFLKKVQESE